MRILICSFTTSGYVPNELYNYLRSKDYDVHCIACPAKHERRFIPGWSHLENLRQIEREAYGYYDIAIAPDPAFVISINRLKKKGMVGKTIYWRLDYYPKKYREPINQAYQKLEQYALSSPDEIWTIADPEIPLIQESLGDALSKTILVPYLLDTVPSSDESLRDTFVMWMGPDLDDSRPLCIEATKSLGVPFIICDYSIDEYRVGEDQLASYLRQAMVGLSPYQPEEVPGKTQPKYYCDASRIRRFLTYGVPVVTTAVAPTHTTLVNEHCGYICDWTPESVTKGIEYCLENFDELSRNAFEAAKRYTYDSWFLEHKVLDPTRLGIDIL